MSDKTASIIVTAAFTIPFLLFLQGILVSLPIPLYAVVAGSFMIGTWGFVGAVVLYRVISGFYENVSGGKNEKKG